ncbi:hypothetical protein [Actinomadura sp. 9N407]|uniref:hypothetical protein n=1 Tax=Actinomadura sp. 9N407 TaxID=3375154 RepID=UPI0037B263AD
MSIIGRRAGGRKIVVAGPRPPCSSERSAPLPPHPPAKPLLVNPAGPARVTHEIENLPVAGRQVEVEVVAAFRQR